MWDFLQNYWAVMALVISEVLAFLPTKVSSIAQVIIKIGTALFGSKDEDKSESAKS